MCLPIDCWLCMPRTLDDDLPPSRHAQRRGGGAATHYTSTGGHYTTNGNGNGGHPYNGNGNNGYTAHSRPAAAEADRKASNDVRRGPFPVHGAGATAGAAQEKAAVVAYPYAAGADDGALKQRFQQQPAAAWNGRVAADGAHGHVARGGAGQHYYYPPAAAHREDAADSYHYSPAAATATGAHHERY